jgi:hypothetical protein
VRRRAGPATVALVVVVAVAASVDRARWDGEATDPATTGARVAERQPAPGARGGLAVVAAVATDRPS